MCSQNVYITNTVFSPPVTKYFSRNIPRFLSSECQAAVVWNETLCSSVGINLPATWDHSPECSDIYFAIKFQSQLLLCAQPGSQLTAATGTENPEQGRADTGTHVRIFGVRYHNFNFSVNPIFVTTWLLRPSPATTFSLAVSTKTTNHKSSGDVRPQYNDSNRAYPATPLKWALTGVMKPNGASFEWHSRIHGSVLRITVFLSQSITSCKSRWHQCTEHTAALNSWRLTDSKSPLCSSVTASQRFMSTGLLDAESSLWLLRTRLFRHAAH